MCGLVRMEEGKMVFGGEGLFVGDILNFEFLILVFEGIDGLIILISVVLKLKFGFDFM